MKVLFMASSVCRKVTLFTDLKPVCQFCHVCDCVDPFKSTLCKLYAIVPSLSYNVKSLEVPVVNWHYIKLNLTEGSS